MKMAKSIRWQLQLWYGLILVAVLAGFGVTAYKLDSGKQFRRTDNELHRRFAAVIDALHPHGHPHGVPPPGYGLPPPEDMGGQLPPPEGPMEDDHRDFSPPAFELPPRLAALFDTNQGSAGYFFQIRGRDHQTIAQLGQLPDPLNLPTTAAPPHPPDPAHPGNDPGQPPVNVPGNYRELVNTLPGGETIIVGCSILTEIKELHTTATVLILVGAAILLTGLLGGWWMVSRALRPIAEISQTAIKIAGGDLARRINVAETGSELGQLAAVLNSTFARLETVFAQQQQFTADAAHELRTPVSVIITQTQMALNRDRAAADYKATVEACQRAAQRMRRLIESLLELARFDAGQEHLKQITFELAPAIAEALQLVAPLAEERRIKLLPDLAAVKVTGDPERIGQVLLNLLTNAIQYNQPGGEVRVTSRRENALVLITVADTGAGIAPADLPRITERFYRADKSRSAGGHGLGLSICRAIISAHGGTLEIASTPGQGTTVLVRLPAIPA